MTNIEPTRGIGDNVDIDQGQIVTDRLGLDYAQQKKTLDELLAEAAKRTVKVSSDDMAVERGSLIKRFGDLDKRLESHREAEKNPYWRACNAVDNFFFAMRDIIGKRDKKNRAAKPGITDIMQGEIDEWQNFKIAEENARLAREKAEADRIAREQEEARRKAEAAAAEAAAATARARSEATRKARQAEEDAAHEKAALAKAQADLAEQQAEEARLATLVKPADLVRVRGSDNRGGGVLLTTAREPYAVLTNRTLVNMEALRPYFTDAEIEKALRGWAKATNHQVQMAGAEIGHRNKGVTR